MKGAERQAKASDGDSVMCVSTDLVIRGGREAKFQRQATQR